MNVHSAQMNDQDFWFQLDGHISFDEVKRKVESAQGLILEENGNPIGLLRYNLFWNEIPFCNLVMINEQHRRKGAGRFLMEVWCQTMHNKVLKL